MYKTSNKQSINSSKGDKSTHRSKSPLKSKRHKELNKWILIDKGSHSKVYLVEKPRRLIIKKIQKQPLIEKNLLANVTREIQILPRLKHPFIAEFLSSYQTEDSIYIALEYYPNGDLADLLVSKRKISEESARFYICQVILALEYLHSMDIVYRDLKAENILIDEDGNTRLTDFGLSKEGVNRENLTRTICGTLAYLPPEVLSGKPYGKTVDWYLLGVLLYELIVGFPPFYNSDR